MNEIIKNCQFCQINLDRTRIIDEIESTITILSNPALVNFYCLVIPKRHVEKLNDLEVYERKELFHQVIKLQELLLKRFGGCDIRQNYRPFQLQSNLKVNYLHIYLQPLELKDELYTNCQIFEIGLFRDLGIKELNEIIQEIKNLKNAN